jgi:hypothetical protein
VALERIYKVYTAMGPGTLCTSQSPEGFRGPRMSENAASALLFSGFMNNPG